MKARYRPYNPEEGYFTFIDPEDIKQHHPLLKAIDSFVEEHISVEPFSQSARNEPRRLVKRASIQKCRLTAVQGI